MRNLFAITTLRKAVSAGLLAVGLSVFSAAGVRGQDAPPPPPPAEGEAEPLGEPDQHGGGAMPEGATAGAGIGYATCDPCACNTCDTCDWCNLGDPWSLSDHLCGECNDSGITIGGWTQLGYHTDSDGIFNTNPDEVSLHQQWLYIEKIANGECGMDWGFRFDVMYGLDGENTQAFGNPPGTWDFQNGFDHGIYHWALPQLYGEIASGDWSVKAGHFYTIHGYESVMAPNNFFYSHAFTFNFNEPFTHTGVLGTYTPTEDVTIWAGWTAGWDTGFERNDDGDDSKGSNFLGGVSLAMSDSTKLIYAFSAGDFGVRGEGYAHSIILDMTLSDNWNYVFHTDLVETNTPGDHQFAVVNYLFYTVNDCLKYGVRGEWWDADDASIYEVTAGVNYRPSANLVIRPEVRHQWTDDDAFANGLGINDETIFGIDAVLTY